MQKTIGNKDIENLDLENLDLEYIDLEYIVLDHKQLNFTCNIPMVSKVISLRVSHPGSPWKAEWTEQ
jgi:hypothetical protein